MCVFPQIALAIGVLTSSLGGFRVPRVFLDSTQTSVEERRKDLKGLTASHPKKTSDRRTGEGGVPHHFFPFLAGPQVDLTG